MLAGVWITTRIQNLQVKIQTHAPVWRVFPPLSYPFYIFGELFPDLASENTDLLASLTSVLRYDTIRYNTMTDDLRLRGLYLILYNYPNFHLILS
jgi:hypothetical protein